MTFRESWFLRNNVCITNNVHPLFFIPFFVFFFGATEIMQMHCCILRFTRHSRPFVVKSIQSFLVLTNCGVSRQVFFGDKGKRL